MLKKNKILDKILFLIPLLILVDQAAKFIFINKIILIKGFPIILFRQNTGIAFSFLQNFNPLLIIINVIIIILLAYLYFKNINMRLGLILMISGAVSNTLDRIFYGYVVDFINFGFWPVFNLADAFASVGLFIIVIKLIKEK